MGNAECQKCPATLVRPVDGPVEAHPSNVHPGDDLSWSETVARIDAGVPLDASAGDDRGPDYYYRLDPKALEPNGDAAAARVALEPNGDAARVALEANVAARWALEAKNHADELATVAADLGEGPTSWEIWTNTGDAVSVAEAAATAASLAQDAATARRDNAALQEELRALRGEMVRAQAEPARKDQTKGASNLEAIQAEALYTLETLRIEAFKVEDLRTETLSGELAVSEEARQRIPGQTKGLRELDNSLQTLGKAVESFVEQQAAQKEQAAVNQQVNAGPFSAAASEVARLREQARADAAREAMGASQRGPLEELAPPGPGDVFAASRQHAAIRRRNEATRIANTLAAAAVIKEA